MRSEIYAEQADILNVIQKNNDLSYNRMVYWE